MRAIIICTTDLTPDELQAGLSRIGWWSDLPQDSPAVAERRKMILSEVASQDQNEVAEMLWFTIHNATLNTWGIVESPSTGRITVRLQNDDIAILKRACEDFVRSVQRTLGEPDRRGIDRLDFLPELQILPPRTAKATLRGEILTETRLHNLIEERRVEYRTARSALILALVIFAVTIPPVEQPFYKASETTAAWARWGFGILERVGTAAITTFTMFCFDIVQRLRHLKENTVVRWL
ncbi:MAG: hypothetical protein H7145_05245 [Akkermansiaceae bacterium]|nr:hypothetical protein [Armatimonadota bacterium]